MRWIFSFAAAALLLQSSAAGALPPLGIGVPNQRLQPVDGDPLMLWSSLGRPTLIFYESKTSRSQNWPFKKKLKDLDASVNTAVGRLGQELCRTPRPSEIAAWLDIPVSEVIEGLQVHNAYRCVSLNEPLGTEPSGESPHASTFGELDPGVALVEDRNTLGPLLDALSEREQRIVLLRFFGNMTQTQIAQEIGVSQMHVSRLLTATLKRLRQALTAET